MKDLIKQIYDGIFHTAIEQSQNKSANKSKLRERFPEVGFLQNGDVKDLEALTKCKVRHIGFYEQAFTHRSYLHVFTDKKNISNERLEFLGDAVLDVIIAEYLFSLHSDELEGELTKMRSWLVNKNALALCAQKVDLQRFLMMSYSAQKALENGSLSILADAMEALIAAIYLDRGLTAAQNFVLQVLMPILLEQKVMEDKNYKSMLLEASQSKGEPAPTYEIVGESGPDHNKIFVAAAFIGDKLLAEGTGKSKKEAEQSAAKNALNDNCLNN